MESKVAKISTEKSESQLLEDLERYREKTLELDAANALASRAPKAESISKFPSIRRDIAVVVDDKIPAADLISAVESSAPELISSVRIFDIYTGPGIEAGLKSVALGLILQETSRTLTDDDADAAMAAAVQKIQEEFGGELRD